MTQMYPAGAPPNKELADTWTWDFFLQARREMPQGRPPVRRRAGQTGDTANWVGAVFNSHGAELVDKDGNTTVKSRTVKAGAGLVQAARAVLAAERLFAWDDSSQQQGADLGPGALIFNPPSAWAVACATRRRSPSSAGTSRRRRGRRAGFDPAATVVSGAYGSSRQNKAAAKSLVLFLWSKESVEQAAAGGGRGYDIPPFAKLARLQDLGRGSAAQGRL